MGGLSNATEISNRPGDFSHADGNQRWHVREEHGVIDDSSGTPQSRADSEQATALFCVVSTSVSIGIHCQQASDVPSLFALRNFIQFLCATGASSEVDLPFPPFIAFSLCGLGASPLLHSSLNLD